MKKVISIVGAGGKTTLVHRLAEEYRRKGQSVLVTTTTHMFVEADTDLSCDFFAVKEKIKKCGYCMAGMPCKSTDTSAGIKSAQNQPVKMKPAKINPAKMQGIPYNLLDRIIREMSDELDYVIIEADGARHHSLKYPAADEPVIYPGTTDVIIVLGTWEKGKACGDVVFRHELMQQELGIAPERIVDDELIETLRRVYVDKLRKMGFEDHIETIYMSKPVDLNTYV